MLKLMLAICHVATKACPRTQQVLLVDVNLICGLGIGRLESSITLVAVAEESLTQASVQQQSQLPESG